VISNALRLNLFKLRDASHDKKIRTAAKSKGKKTGNNKMVRPEAATAAAVTDKETKIKEEKIMKKTMKIEGMMCGHCEARVKKALEALPQIDEAVVSHEAGTAIVTLNADVADEVLTQAVEAQDYKVISVQ
jgi:Cu2+-exporting ATPase